jgi:hypothetical protein
MLDAQNIAKLAAFAESLKRDEHRTKVREAHKVAGAAKAKATRARKAAEKAEAEAQAVAARVRAESVKRTLAAQGITLS